jgi:mRNA interferase YafQ
MNYKVVYSRRFVKSLKRVRNYPGFKEAKLMLAIELLSAQVQLPEQFHDHALSGDMKGCRECHIAPDILVIYEVADEILELLLINIGNHAQLFR